MAKAVRLQDIAARIGVSTVTVSKALSGQKGMSDALRRQIIETAAEMGYVRDSSRHHFSDDPARTYRIGILVADRFLDQYVSFYSSMQQLVAKETAARRCATLLAGISPEMEQAGILPGIMVSDQLDGVILIGRLKDTFLTVVHETGIPAIYLDFSSHLYDEDAVVSDNYYGAYTLTNHLFSMGHTRIAYVGTILATSSITDRYFGYRRSMLEHGCDVPVEWIIPDRDSEQGVLDINRFFTLPRDMPTAFVCNSDLTAAMMIRKLDRSGYDVPGDISVTGYDNFLYPGLCDIGITTFNVDAKEMSRQAVQNLLHKLDGESYRHGVTIIGGQFIERESTQLFKNR